MDTGSKMLLDLGAVQFPLGASFNSQDVSFIFAFSPSVRFSLSTRRTDNDISGLSLFRRPRFASVVSFLSLPGMIGHDSLALPLSAGPVVFLRRFLRGRASAMRAQNADGRDPGSPEECLLKIALDEKDGWRDCQGRPARCRREPPSPRLPDRLVKLRLNHSRQKCLMPAWSFSNRREAIWPRAPRKDFSDDNDGVPLSSS